MAARTGNKATLTQEVPMLRVFAKLACLSIVFAALHIPVVCLFGAACYLAGATPAMFTALGVGYVLGGVAAGVL